MSLSHRIQISQAEARIANAVAQIESIYSTFQLAMDVLSVQSDLPEQVDDWMQQGLSLASDFALKLDAKERGGKCLR